MIEHKRGCVEGGWYLVVSPSHWLHRQFGVSEILLDGVWECVEGGRYLVAVFAHKYFLVVE